MTEEYISKTKLMKHLQDLIDDELVSPDCKKYSWALMNYIDIKLQSIKLEVPETSNDTFEKFKQFAKDVYGYYIVKSDAGISVKELFSKGENHV